MKQLLKLTAGDKTRTMNYIVRDDIIYVLTLETSKKIEDINEDNEVQLTLVGTDQKNVDAKANIINDDSLIQSIFDEMIAEDNSHFKKLSEKIVAIKFEK